MNGRKKKIGIIQALRGIAALGIVYFHTEYGPWKSANWGVEFFFILSGYFLMLSTEKMGGYWPGKLKKLLPLYYIMTVVAAVGCLLVPSAFRSTVVNAETLTKSFLFIPCEARSGKIFPVYSIGWTLNLEMFFYVLFYCGMRISHKHRGLITAAVTGILVILGQALTPQDTVLRFWTQAELVNFVIGIGIYGVEKEVGNIRMDRRICLVGIAISLVMLFSGKYLMKGHFSFLWNTLWGGAMLFLSLPIKDMPANQYLTHLGDMSYSIYLTHFMVIGVICRILIDNKVYSIKNTVIVVTAIGISLACAGIAYRFIETPFYVRRRMDKRFPKSGNKLETEE